MSIEDRPWSAPGGPLGDYMQWTVKGHASAAVGWVVHDGSRIEPCWTYSVAMPAVELSDTVAKAIVLANVGSSPKGTTPKDAAHQQWSQAWNEAIQAVHLQNAKVVRCVYGNPFRPARFDPKWRTADVQALARAIYDDRAFERTPILADALMDAGCEDEQVISHCRGDGPHVQGCWVVDLVLEKE
jgi:hypothetical protein